MTSSARMVRRGLCGSMRAAASGSFGPQLVEQSTGALGFLAFLKTCAHVGIGAGEGDVVDGRSGVQAGAADENRAGCHVIAGRRWSGARKLLESGHAHRVFGVDDVDEIGAARPPVPRRWVWRCRYPCHGTSGRRPRSRFRPAPRFGQTPGDGDAQPRLAGRGGTDDGDDSLRVIHAPSVPHGIGLAGGHVGVGKQIMAAGVCDGGRHEIADLQAPARLPARRCAPARRFSRGR